MARKHRWRRLGALAFIVTGLAAAFQPAPASGAASISASALGAATTTMTHAATATGRLAGTVTTASRTGGTGGNGSATDGAAVAIDLITAPNPPSDLLSHIPAEFHKVMGYQPALGHLANGATVAINPNGGCSVVGGGRPFDLDVACKAHDLGYDLLRYAHREGADLGPRARHLVDDKFGVDLVAQCQALYTGGETDACDVMAASFEAGVSFNSWRQEFGAPIATAGRVRTTGVLALGALLLYFLARGLLRLTTRPLLRSRQVPAFDDQAA